MQLIDGNFNKSQIKNFCFKYKLVHTQFPLNLSFLSDYCTIYREFMKTFHWKVENFFQNARKTSGFYIIERDFSVYTKVWFLDLVLFLLPVILYSVLFFFGFFFALAPQ